jgi:hypothetical protein
MIPTKVDITLPYEPLVKRAKLGLCNKFFLPFKTRTSLRWFISLYQISPSFLISIKWPKNLSPTLDRKIGFREPHHKHVRGFSSSVQTEQAP